MLGPSKHLKFNAPRASSFTSFGFFAAAAILMMVVDHQMQVMEPVRSGFSYVADSLHSAVSAPSRLMRDASDYFHSKSKLVAENEMLKKRLAESEMTNFRIGTLNDENKVLKEMLQQKTLFPVRTAMFEVRRALSDGLLSAIKLTADPTTGLKSGCLW